jgi:hypothetical protein
MWELWIMNRLLSGNSIDFLAGKRLEQLAVGLHELQFNFEKEVSIVIQSKVIVHRQNHPTVEINADVPEQTRGLTFLLGRSITEFEAGDQKDLTLSFDDGSDIIIVGSNGLYEAYVIWNKGDYIAIQA